MKKILAAVLAAAMALSMSAVAFAKNFEANGTVGGDGEVVSASGTTKTQVLGLSRTYVIAPGLVGGRLANGSQADVTAEVLYNLIDSGAVKVDVAVLSNKKALSGTPSVTTGKDSASNPAAVMKVSFNDTWGTTEEVVEMRIRITAKEEITVDTIQGTVDTDTRVVLEKGDTVTLDNFKVKAEYGDIQEYGENITMTLDEVKVRDIVADAESLYNNADDDNKVVIYFKNNRSNDVAAYEVKISENQKDVNLGYDVTPIDWVTEDYPDVEFEFINFKSTKANHFINNGTMYFNPIGGADTVVYEVVDGDLVKMDSKYDSEDKVVYVKNIRDLTSYVVASEELPSEEPAEEPTEEPSEPADTTPTNPGTGAL